MPNRAISLPVFDRIAPAPPPAVVAARIDQHTGPGDVVADLFGRGGWVARAAVDRQRRDGLARVEPADADARRGRPAPARRPPPRRRVPGDGRLAAPRHRASRSRSATCSRPAARRAAGRSSSDEIAWSVDDEVGDRRAGAAGRPGTTAARSAATSAAARSSARRRSTPTTCGGPRPTSAPRRCAPACSRASRDRARRRGPARRAARPPHGPPAGRPGRHPRADRGRPARRAGPGRPSPRAPPRDPAGQPARDPAGSDRRAARLVRPRPAPVRDPVPRTEPVAGLRGRVPDGPRVHPAPRGRDDRARSRRGSARTCAASGRARPRRCSP